MRKRAMVASRGGGRWLVCGLMLTGVVAWAEQPVMAANGENLVEFQRSDGTKENYYTAIDPNLEMGLAAADEAFTEIATDPTKPRDGLDEFVPIELKRWNNNAAKALMLKLARDFYSVQEPTTHLVPKRGNPANTTTLRFPSHAARLLEWTQDDAVIVAQTRALADATMTYFTPSAGGGFLEGVSVLPQAPPPPLDTKIHPSNFGLALLGMGALSALFNDGAYWGWAAPRLDFAWLNRGTSFDLFANFYTAIGSWEDPAEPYFDTDTLYMVRFAYEGARQASDHGAMARLESVARRWFEKAWYGDPWKHCARKLNFSDGLAYPGNTIYNDGKPNCLYNLSVLYRITGDKAVMDRIVDMWDTYVDTSPTHAPGLIPYQVTAGVGDEEVSPGQAGMLDALIDAYSATGSPEILQRAQDFAADILSYPDLLEDSIDATARPFLRVAEATYGSIGRLEVNFGAPSGRLIIRTTAGAIVFNRLLPNQSAVVYLPPGTYRTELQGVFGPRSVILDVTADGVAVDYLPGSPAASYVEGRFVQDVNDNGVADSFDPASSGARVYSDANNNGSYNLGESNVVVGSSGIFTLSQQVGTRTIRAVPPSTTSRWTAPSTRIVNGSPGYAFVFHTNGLKVRRNFSWTQRKRMSGRVFHDANGNGLQNTGERGLADSFVYVDLDNDLKRDLGEPFATTAADGSYSLGSLPNTGVLRVVRRTAVPTIVTPASGSYAMPAQLAQHVTNRHFAVR